MYSTPRRAVQRQPTFPAPPPRLAPPTKVDFRRRSGDDRLTGDVPANTLPMPTDSAHLGDAAESPTLPSSVRVSGPTSAWVRPAPRERLRACVESDWPTSTPSETLVVQRGDRSYVASPRSDVARGALSADWAESPPSERLHVAADASRGNTT